MNTRNRIGLLAALLAASLTASAEQAPGTTPKLQQVGITLGYLNNPFFQVIADNTTAKLRQLAGTDVKFNVVSGDYDLKFQRDQISNFINAGVDLLILGAVDSAGIYPAVAQAKAAGIPVVAVDVAAAGADAVVMSDNEQAGRLGCRYIAERLQGQGNVVIINGPPVSAVADRVRGCQSELAQHPGITLLSADRDGGGNPLGGQEVMTTLLTQFAHIDAVFAQNDPTGIGASLAAQQAGRDEFFIVAVDGSPDVIQLLQQPGSLFAASAAQNPRQMATQAAEIAYHLLQGTQPAQQTTLIPVALITRDNVGEYRGW